MTTDSRKIDAISAILAAEVQYLDATGWQPVIIDRTSGIVRFRHPKYAASRSYTQYDALALQRSLDTELWRGK